VKYDIFSWKVTFLEEKNWLTWWYICTLFCWMYNPKSYILVHEDPTYCAIFYEHEQRQHNQTCVTQDFVIWHHELLILAALLPHNLAAIFADLFSTFFAAFVAPIQHLLWFSNILICVIYWAFPLVQSIKINMVWCHSYMFMSFITLNTFVKWLSSFIWRLCQNILFYQRWSKNEVKFIIIVNLIKVYK